MLCMNGMLRPHETSLHYEARYWTSSASDAWQLYAGRAIAKLDPVAREILRVGLYELMELELADHAIGSHVEIVRAMGSPHLAGFVNGMNVSLYACATHSRVGV